MEIYGKNGHNIKYKYIPYIYIYVHNKIDVISCNNISLFLTSLLEGGDGGRLYHSANLRTLKMQSS